MSQAWIRLSLAHASEGGPCKQALDAARQCMNVAPEYHVPYILLGLLLFQCEDFAGAEDALSYAAYTLNTDEHIAFFLLGQVLWKREDYELAEEAFRQASEIDPEDHATYSALGNVLLKRKDLAGAGEAFSQASLYDAEDEDPLAKIHVLLNDE